MTQDHLAQIHAGERLLDALASPPDDTGRATLRVDGHRRADAWVYPLVVVAALVAGEVFHHSGFNQVVLPVALLATLAVIGVELVTGAGSGTRRVVPRLTAVPTLRRTLGASVALGVLAVPLASYLDFFLDHRWGMDAGARVAVLAVTALAAWPRRPAASLRRRRSSPRSSSSPSPAPPRSSGSPSRSWSPGPRRPPPPSRTCWPPSGRWCRPR